MMAPLSILLALLLAHSGTSIISGSSSQGALEDKNTLLESSDTQSRRIGVGVSLVPGGSSSVPAPSPQSKRHHHQSSKLRGSGDDNLRLSGQASHLHGAVFTGGYGGPGGGLEGGFGGQHHSGLGFYGGSGVDGFGGDLGGHEIHSHHEFDHHHHHLEHHHDPHFHKALALKSLLIPLAGVALLGAAAAFVTNPILLQLGVISGKRRRRNVPLGLGPRSEDERLARQRVSDLQLLENFMAQIPLSEARAQEKRLLASYLTCTGIVPASNDSSDISANGACLERLSCELNQHQTDSAATPLERHVMRVVTGEILSNEYIPDTVKKNVKSAVQRGENGEDCSKFYQCQDLDEQKK